MKKYIFLLSSFMVAVFFVSCVEEKKIESVGRDEGSNRLIISRFYNSNPLINQVEIRTPLSEYVDGVMVDKKFVYIKIIRAESEDFNVEFKIKNAKELSDVNFNKIFIEFEDGEKFSYSKKSNMITSIVYTYDSLYGNLFGVIDYNKKLVKKLQSQRVKRFCLENQCIKLDLSEAEILRKDIVSVMRMK